MPQEAVRIQLHSQDVPKKYDFLLDAYDFRMGDNDPDGDDSLYLAQESEEMSYDIR